MDNLTCKSFICKYYKYGDLNIDTIGCKMIIIIKQRIV